MCIVHISLCQECDITRETSRRSCGRRFCGHTEIIRSAPQLCSMHTHILAHQSFPYPEYPVRDCDSPRLRYERDRARSENTEMEKTLKDLRDALDLSKKEAAEKAEKSRDQAVDRLDTIARLTANKLSDEKILWACDKTTMEAKIAKAQSETEAAQKAAKEVKETLKKKDEELAAAKKTLSKIQEEEMIAAYKGAFKKAVMKEMNRALFGRR